MHVEANDLDHLAKQTAGLFEVFRERLAGSFRTPRGVISRIVVSSPLNFRYEMEYGIKSLDFATSAPAVGRGVDKTRKQDQHLRCD